MSLKEINKLAIQENWHTLPKDAPENKVYILSLKAEDKKPVLENKEPKSTDVTEPVKVNKSKTKKKGKKK